MNSTYIRHLCVRPIIYSFLIIRSVAYAGGGCSKLPDETCFKRFVQLKNEQEDLDPSERILSLKALAKKVVVDAMLTQKLLEEKERHPYCSPDVASEIVDDFLLQRHYFPRGRIALDNERITQVDYLNNTLILSTNDGVSIMQDLLCNPSRRALAIKSERNMQLYADKEDSAHIYAKIKNGMHKFSLVDGSHEQIALPPETRLFDPVTKTAFFIHGRQVFYKRLHAEEKCFYESDASISFLCLAQGGSVLALVREKDIVVFDEQGCERARIVHHDSQQEHKNLKPLSVSLSPAGSLVVAYYVDESLKRPCMSIFSFDEDTREYKRRCTYRLSGPRKEDVEKARISFSQDSHYFVSRVPSQHYEDEGDSWSLELFSVHEKTVNVVSLLKEFSFATFSPQGMLCVFSKDGYFLAIPLTAQARRQGIMSFLSTRFNGDDAVCALQEHIARDTLGVQDLKTLSIRTRFLQNNEDTAALESFLAVTK